MSVSDSAPEDRTDTDRSGSDHTDTVDFELESAMTPAELDDVRRWERLTAESEARTPAPVKPQYMSMSRSSFAVTKPEPKLNSFAVASVILALLGGIGGIVFGHLALVGIARTGDKGTGLAFAGLVVGYVVAAVLIVWLIVMTVLNAT